MAKHNLVADLRHIERHIELLSDIVSQADVEACVYEFPKLTKLDIGMAPKAIKLTQHTGSVAKATTLHHIRDFKVTDEEPGQFGRRMAGTIIIQSKEGLEIAQRITAINTLKDNFQASILALHKNIDSRFEIFRDALPRVSKKATTRHILLAEPDTRAVNFSWTHRYSGKKFTREQLVKQITHADKRPPVQWDHADWDSVLKSELQAISNANHTNVFYQRRPIRVAPTAHLYNTHDKTSKTMIAHSPIFVINQTPHIGLFHDYPNRQRVSNVKPLMLVILRRHIYCELP